MMICSKKWLKNSQHDHQKPSSEKVYWLSLMIDFQLFERGMPIKPLNFLNYNNNKNIYIYIYIGKKWEF